MHACTVYISTDQDKYRLLVFQCGYLSNFCYGSKKTKQNKKQNKKPCVHMILIVRHVLSIENIIEYYYMQNLSQVP